MIRVRNVIFEELYTLEIEDLKEVSQVLFQVVTYIERYKNFSNEVILTKKLILDRYSIKPTRRNLSRITKAINYLISVGVIYIDNIEDVNGLNSDSMIHIVIDESVNKLYRKHDIQFIDRLIESIQIEDEKYMCGLVFYFIAYKIKYYSTGAGYTSARISYQEIMDVLPIGNRNTIGKYVRFLEENKFIISETKQRNKVKRQGDKEENKQLKEVYKIYSMPSENNKDKKKSK